MARGLRIERAGWHYHVTSRALEGRKIFREEAEKAHFVELIGEAVERFDWVLHGYVLMGNHYHLLLQTREANLSRSIQWLGQSYTAWFNRRETRVGPLWQGRYKSSVLDWEEAGLEVSRYVHLNPVRVSALGLGKRDRLRRGSGALQGAMWRYGWRRRGRI